MRQISESKTFAESFTLVGASCLRGRKYKHRLFEVSRRLAEGAVVPDVCRELDISKQLARHYVKRGLDKHILKIAVPSRPIIYTKGPCYYLFKEGGQGRQSKTISRTHPGVGTAYIFDKIKSGDCNDFTDRLSGKTTIQQATIDIPSNIAGFDNARTKLDLRTYNDIQEELRVYPCNRYQSYKDFLQYHDPFYDSLNYSISFLVDRGWRVDYSSCRFVGDVHYGFQLSDLGSWKDHVAPFVPHLTRFDGGQQTDYYLWIDESGGRNRYELETNLRHYAEDVFALDTVRMEVRNVARI